LAQNTKLDEAKVLVINYVLNVGTRFPEQTFQLQLVKENKYYFANSVIATLIIQLTTCKIVIDSRLTRSAVVYNCTSCY